MKIFCDRRVFYSSLNILVAAITAAYTREIAAVLRVDRHQLLIRGEPASRARSALQLVLIVRSRHQATFAIIRVRFYRMIIAYKNR
jgi:hypothetical protein